MSPPLHPDVGETWPEAHGVEDVPALAREAMEARLRSWGASLREHDRDDLLAEMVALAFTLARGFDERRGVLFSTWCYRMIQLRLADWYRARLGDSRHPLRNPDGSVASEGGWKAAEHMSDEELALVVDDWDLIGQTLSVINVMTLKPCERRTFEWIAKPIAFEGATLGELSQRLGWSRRRITHDLEDLREAIAA